MIFYELISLYYYYLILVDNIKIDKHTEFSASK